jgi:hypothetical protein
LDQKDSTFYTYKIYFLQQIDGPAFGHFLLQLGCHLISSVVISFGDPSGGIMGCPPIAPTIEAGMFQRMSHFCIFY